MMFKRMRKNGLAFFVLLCAISAVLFMHGTAYAGQACLPSGGATIKIDDTAYMRINYQFQLYGTYRDTGSGPTGTDTTTDFFFRRNRLTVSGVATDKLSYILMLEHSGERKIGPVEVVDEAVGEFNVLEGFVIAELSGAVKFNAGKMKIPFMREILEGCFSNLSLDRSLFIYSPYQRSRDTGVALWGNLMKSKVQYILSAMDGQESVDAPKSSPRFGGRVHLALLDPEDTYGYSGTYMGNKMVLTIGAAAQYEPGAAYSDTAAQTGEKDYTAWTADLFFEYPIGSAGTVTLSGAYLKTDFDGAYTGSNPDPGSVGLDGEKKGWYAKAGYLHQNKIGPGQIQPYVRFEKWEYAELMTGMYRQKLTWIGGGLNYLINGQNLRIGLEYSVTDFEDESDPRSKDFTTINTMLQVGF
jgi:hypothetical protein